MKHWKFLLFAALAVVIFAACDDDDPEPENEEEVITTLILTFSPDGGGDDIVQTFRDLDGDGGDPPVITTNPLDADTDYTLTIRLLNETEDPAEEVTEEVEEEDDEHQFFFDISGLNLNITYGDSDDDGNPIGLTNDASAGSASNGTLQVTLRHEPDKDASGVSDGDITNAGGETDIEVDFSIEIQ